MNKNEILEQFNILKEKFLAIQKNINLAEKNKEIDVLKKKMAEPNFWDDQVLAQKISQDFSCLQNFIKNWNNISNFVDDFENFLDIASDQEIFDLEKELKETEKNFKDLEIQLLLSDQFDKKNAILSIQVGNGGQDAEDFSQILLRMYLRYCEQKNFKTKILDESNTEAGIKSATIEISGSYAYGFLKSEHGVHRLIRLSPFNAKNLRQTSFSRVEIIPVMDNYNEISINSSDLRIDVFRSSGAGGQSVNTTDSAVRITYLPLNLAVTCQNERSQLQNKENALQILKSRLMKLQSEQNAQKISEIRGEKINAAFGSQIRTYTLQPYKLVKDHRTNIEHSSPEKVFDGGLDIFLEGFLYKNTK